MSDSDGGTPPLPEDGAPEDGTEGLTRKQKKNRRARQRKKEKEKEKKAAAAAAAASASSLDPEETGGSAQPPSEVPLLPPPPPPPQGGRPQLEIPDPIPRDALPPPPPPDLPVSPRKITPLVLDDHFFGGGLDDADEGVLVDEELDALDALEQTMPPSPRRSAPSTLGGGSSGLGFISAPTAARMAVEEDDGGPDGPRLVLPVAGPGDRSKTPPASHAARSDGDKKTKVIGSSSSSKGLPSSRSRTPPASHAASDVIRRERTPPASHASGSGDDEDAEGEEPDIEEVGLDDDVVDDDEFEEFEEVEKEDGEEEAYGEDGEGGEQEGDDADDADGNDEDEEDDDVMVLYEDLDAEGQEFCLTTLLRLARRMGGLEKAVMKELVLQHDPVLINAAITESALPALVSQVLDRVLEAAMTFASEDWAAIFAGLSDQDAKRLAKEGARQLSEQQYGGEDSGAGGSSGGGVVAGVGKDLTYGEVEFGSFAMILEVAVSENVESEERGLFVDIGHGTGRAVLAAALLYGHRFRECRGVEILEPLVDASLVAQQRYESRIASRPELYDHGDRAAVSMIHGDLLAADPDQDGAWTDGDIVFANSTCFSRDLMDSIAAKAAGLKPGATIITLTQPLNSPALKMTKARQFPMSWGPATAFFHVRV